MPTITEQFTANTEALNALSTQVQDFLNDPIVADKLKQLAIGDLSGALDGAILRYHAAESEFRLMNLGIDETFKADLAGIDDGFLLKWDSAQSKFVAVSPTSAPIAFEGLTNTPGSLTGLGGKVLAVADDEMGVVARNAIAAAPGTQYAAVREIQVVPGNLVSFLAGIQSISEDAPLVPKLDGPTAAVTTNHTNYQEQYGPWRAFDRLSDTVWGGSLVWVGGEAWLRYDFGVNTQVGAYKIAIWHTPGHYSPRSWVFEGSNDDSS